MKDKQAPPLAGDGACGFVGLKDFIIPPAVPSST